MPENQLQQATALFKAGQRTEAHLIAKAIIADDPHNAAAWAILAQTADTRAESLVALRTVLELSDDEKIRSWARRHLTRLENADQEKQRFSVKALLAIMREEPLLAGAASVLLLILLTLFLLNVVRLTGIVPEQITPTIVAIQPTTVATRTPRPTPEPPVIIIEDTSTPRPSSTPAPTATPTATPTLTPTPLPPEPATLRSPGNNNTLPDYDVSLRWGVVPNADQYQVVVNGPYSLDKTYSATDKCGENTCTITLSGSNLLNGSYSWYVFATNQAGGTVSDTATFTRAFVPHTGFELGAQLPNAINHTNYMQQAGMSWIKFQVQWSEMPIDEVGALINAAHGSGFKVLLSVKGPLYPTSIDYATYVDYVRQVAGQNPDAIEVWNEMNLAVEWPAGQIDPASYVNNMLAPAYSAIKSVNPNILVISGALASTGVHDEVNVWSDDRYVQGMARAGAARYADCIGFHHNAAATSPYATSGHPADDGRIHYSWYFKSTVDIYWKGFNGARPLCLTELGVLSGDGYAPLGSKWAWASSTSSAEQAQWVGEAAQYSKDLGYIRMMIIWNMDFAHWTDDDPQAGFAIVRPGDVCPACGILGGVLAQ